jgi:hypothetical protein
MAKDGKYCHGSNAEHRSSLSTKMNVTQPPLVLASSPLQKVARMVASEPRPAARTHIHYAPPPVQPVGLRISFRHRSPPSVVSL